MDFPDDQQKDSIRIMLPCSDSRTEKVERILKDKFEGKTIRNKKIVISSSKNLDDIASMSLVFVSDSCSNLAELVKAEIGDKPIIFVGYNLEYGLPMFNMIVVEGSLKFSINEPYVDQNNLTLTDKLRKLGAKNIVSSKTEWNSLVARVAELKEEIINQNNQLAKDQSTIKDQGEKLNIALIFGVVISIVGIIVFLFYRTNKKLNKKLLEKNVQIENQNKEIKNQHQEIVDSLLYAKRIQSAILPSAKLVKEFLVDSFILYKPKDIVAGDFYWMEHKDGKILFAAADCTGHGVPGAMVSVICNGALNRSVREFDLSDPGEILDKSREIVIEEFNKSEEDVKDGMDIALCALNGNKLEFAGAHNPLWIIRGQEIIETKADKQPIGKFDRPSPYVTHTFQLEEGDTIYIFSDGYVDQFGGERGKKFKTKAFRKLLLGIQDLSMAEQRKVIDDSFESWRGDLEQIDDVCVIGVRI